jgi:lysophospholipid acyltransferase 1/2/lysophospholipid acyltransferase
MAAILRALPHKDLKHLFSFVGGLCMMQWIFGPEWIHSLLSSVITYLICLVVPVKYQPRLVFIWAMTYMTRTYDNHVLMCGLHFDVDLSLIRSFLV